ncbi:hypothetical protein A6024_19175 (plasmid) [Rhodovulum sulfidophilum]|nr:hypothetical protein A6W98_19415 [Rhodovulum sulfidophilum DSM 1374]ANB40134.1 hypothetical protein A6024_19175 [Rhodovulum sulfidophilum]
MAVAGGGVRAMARRGLRSRPLSLALALAGAWSRLVRFSCQPVPDALSEQAGSPVQAGDAVGSYRADAMTVSAVPGARDQAGQAA